MFVIIQGVQPGQHTLAKFGRRFFKWADLKFIGSVRLNVFNFEIKPLLMAFGVEVILNEQVVAYWLVIFLFAKECIL